MGKKAALLLFFGVFYLRVCFCFPSSVNRSSIDEASLLALKTHINSDILAKNWSQETSFCTWVGVRCSQRHIRVTGLNLSNMGLQGTIAREIGNLSFLTVFDISNNSVNGLIPSEIGNLRRLRLLYMAFNRLNDGIPQSLGLLRKLKVLDLSWNYLSGDIPRSLSTCVELNVLQLSYNNLTGDIPIGVGNLSSLQYLYLQHNLLAGEIPSTIFNISSLLEISMAHNQMSGTIPNDICRQPAPKLTVLYLRSNQFEGEIPFSLMRCHSLKGLYLWHNKFSGNVPFSEFQNLSAIEVINLQNNKFTGVVPRSISNLSNLMVFDIGENSLHGTVPLEMGQLSNLTVLNLGLNKLNGEVPESIFNLSKLEVLSLTENNLSGKLPVSIDKAFPNIDGLYLDINQFRGNIPNSITNLSRLTLLELSDNSFTGHIPITLGNLPQLQFLNLGENHLQNNLSKPEEDFLSSLTTCKHLKLIRIESNPITGLLPKSLGSSNLSTSLEKFLAQVCQIIGPLPNEIGNLSNLIWLDLGNNDLTGIIPATVGSLRSMQSLRFAGNKLRGSIFYVLCSLTNLYSVDLTENNLSGQLPRCLGNLSMLRKIDLANNAFNCNLPSTLWLNEHVERINFSNNFLDGSLPPEIGNLKSLIELDLSRNRLTGEIPSTISQLQNLINLSLSNNKFNGPILDYFSNLKDLHRLDLSHNSLSGEIPKSLEALPNLNYFNVSFNQLCGKIPDGGPFANFPAEFFIGNKGLCGALQFKVKECKTSMLSPSRKRNLLNYILPGIGITSTFVAALTIILVLRHCSRLLRSPSLSQLPVLHERISHLEILRATNNLDKENLIGRGSFGSVYNGVFFDAIVVAIKVFHLDIQGALKSFNMECEILRNIRHRNLVKVITSCSNLDFKALVMVYMPGGNLEKWLYSINCYLNIFQRLGIMIDVALALEYLHHGSTYPIIHCDLKPSNILLDEDMVAHVGDFGIAKLLTKEQRMQQTRTLGTIGYIAPEYGSEGLVSTMVDVYSYGILLMEVFSRRKPADEMFSGELTIKRWVSKSFPNSVMHIVDDELLNIDDERARSRHIGCLTSIMGLALECTADVPEMRPLMKDVLARIRKIKLNLLNHN